MRDIDECEELLTSSTDKTHTHTHTPKARHRLWEKFGRKVQAMALPKAGACCSASDGVVEAPREEAPVGRTQ